MRDVEVEPALVELGRALRSRRGRACTRCCRRARSWRARAGRRWSPRASLDAARRGRAHASARMHRSGADDPRGGGRAARRGRATRCSGTTARSPGRRRSAARDLRMRRARQSGRLGRARCRGRNGSGFRTGRRRTAGHGRSRPAATAASEPSPPAIPSGPAAASRAELFQIVVSAEQVRLDSAPPSLVAQLVRAGLPAPRARVDQ